MFREQPIEYLYQFKLKLLTALSQKPVDNLVITIKEVR